MQNLALGLGCCLVLAATTITQTPPPAPTPPMPPNIVVIFIDDMGYADIGPFGGKAPTPNLDRMAAEGMRFTDFVVPSAVCSASRAALLTGCYHRRVGISGALGPDARIGLGEHEVTIAQLCQQQGYATACFGKWHLGHHPKFLPRRHGFDEFFGLPYSNDMWPLHPAYAKLPTEAERRKQGYPPLPLIEGDKVVDHEVTGDDQAMLTTWYTERAVSFIERKQAQPFFLYVPHSMVHVPLFVSEKFRGKSGLGLYGDVVMEIDWSVGEILAALRRHGLDDRTLVIFTSDNGPWLSYGDHAGSAGPLREGKGTSWEGGVRIPTLMRWPGHVRAGTECKELASTIDLLPTVAKLIGAKLPDHTIDGHDITPLLFSVENARSPHEAFWCYYAGGQLQAVRDRRWKLHFPHRYATLGGKPGGHDGSPAPYSNAECGLELYDLLHDVGETANVAAAHPDVVARLQQAAAQARAELGDTLTKTEGKGARPAGKLQEGDARLEW
ncbi:MAG: sulfatase [Planctomycetes bacterium]|nr:sulfatase [Planctomycetota bacterium]MCC7398880.1 sulfatase [Planctomycetota bacterium]